MTIDQYHRSMFEGETIHQSWIDDCAAYLKSIFGDTVSGARVLDYGFGRGNWSLAFRQLGAKEVLSIDASQSAVERFNSYLAANKIQNIRTRVGNLDDENIDVKVDIVFLYGIFHHMAAPSKLMGAAQGWLLNDSGKVLVYAYDAGSMREIVVSACRSLLRNEPLASEWMSALHLNARHRAADDLVAPVVEFWSAKEMVELADKSDLACVSQANDFAKFQGKSLAPEFDPYVFLFKTNVKNQKGLNPEINQHVFVDEYDAIEEALKIVVAQTDRNAAQKTAVGLFNCWFSGAGDATFEERLFYLWRHLCQLLISFKAYKVEVSTKLEVLIALTRRQEHEQADQWVDNCRMFKDRIKNTSYRL